METRTKLVACEYNDKGICTNVFVVKNLTPTEYKKLVNESNVEKAQNKELQDSILLDIARLHTKNKNLLVFVAKCIYDSFVDRGFIDDDNEFEIRWHNFIVSGEDIGEYPPFLSKIIERLGA